MKRMEENLPFAPRESERELFDTLKRHFASVYGGYIRDVLRGVPPRDVDVVVENAGYESLREELSALGYELERQEGEDLFVLAHPTRLPIDLLVDREDSHENTRLSPMAIPDVDVNDLCYSWNAQIGRYGLDRWADDFARVFRTRDIVERLRSGAMVAHAHPEAKPARIAKMAQKGFEVRPPETGE